MARTRFLRLRLIAHYCSENAQRVNTLSVLCVCYRYIYACLFEAAPWANPRLDVRPLNRRPGVGSDALGPGLLANQGNEHAALAKRLAETILVSDDDRQPLLLCWPDRDDQATPRRRKLLLQRLRHARRARRDEDAVEWLRRRVSDRAVADNHPDVRVAKGRERRPRG